MKNAIRILILIIFQAHIWLKN